VQSLGEIMFRYVFSSFGLYCPLILRFLFDFLGGLDVLCIGDSRVLKFPTIIVLCWGPSVLLSLAVFV
jgi:hypothetical protein